jgi:hypothetical protein
MKDLFKGIDFKTPLDLTNIDIIRSDDEEDNFYIRFFKLAACGHRGSLELIETWTFVTPADRDQVFGELWPGFMAAKYPIERT